MDVIELNGKHYDALTGAYMGGGRAVSPAAQHRSQPSATTQQPLRPTPVPHLPVTTPSVVAAPAPAPRRQAPQHLPAHRPQQARTLMRHAVRAPHATPKPAIKPVVPLAPATQSTTLATGTQPAIQPKQTATAVNPQRSQRATGASRSQQVRHFGTGEFVSTAKPVTDLTAANPLTMSIRPSAAIISKAQPQTAVTTLTAKPAMATTAAPAQPRRQSLRPQQAFRGTAQEHRRAAARHQAAAAARQSAPADDTEQNIFEQALALATSHEQKPPKQSVLRAARRRKRLRRVLSIAASAAVFLALSGFIAYQNKANIQLQFASAKAGFPASTPGFKPEGFAMNKITYSPGVVATWYGNQDKTFSLIQKKSNWDSQTLLENFVSTTNEDYQGYQANGRTVYVYGKGRATWVNGGIWYQIDAGDVLSDEHLVKVAASI